MPGPFPYTRLIFEPPAPSFLVDVSFNGISISKRGMIDSGSDNTFIPVDLAERLNLEKIGDKDFDGATGTTETCDLYLVRLEFHDLVFNEFPVYSLKNEDTILIGRDILNDYNITLDGPRLEYSITHP